MKPREENQPQQTQQCTATPTPPGRCVVCGAREHFARRCKECLAKQDTTFARWLQWEGYS